MNQRVQRNLVSLMQELSPGDKSEQEPSKATTQAVSPVTFIRVDPPIVKATPRKLSTKMRVWFSEEDAVLVEKISAARGQRPEDLIRQATLKLLAELGVVGEERKRFLITLGR